MLGGAQQQLGDGDSVQVGEVRVRPQRAGHAAQVAHVDAARVQRLRQPRAVHRRRRVLQALTNLRTSYFCHSELYTVHYTNLNITHPPLEINYQSNLSDRHDGLECRFIVQTPAKLTGYLCIYFPVNENQTKWR